MKYKELREIHIDIVSGFLESGKTSFIKNKIMMDPQFREYEKKVLLVCEEGIAEYDNTEAEKNGVHIITLADSSELNQQLFSGIRKEYNPGYIIIEYNGTWDISLLLELKLPYDYSIRNIIFISETENFTFYLNNMGRILAPQIQNSDLVVFNPTKDCDNKTKKTLKKIVHAINPRTEVLFQKYNEPDNKLNKYFAPHEKYQKITPGLIITAVLLVVLCLIPYSLLGNIYDYIRSISMVFLSILLQALPFLLLGAFVSAVIQAAVPAAWVLKQFTSGSIRSFFFAAIGGFFFPICDCGMVPVVSGLLKKDTPLPQTMTFWLASAAVNPVVILSVIYAFPGQSNVVFIRILAGLAIGILVGVILKAAGFHTKDVIRDNSTVNRVGGVFLEEITEKPCGKVLLILDSANSEFFRVSRYVIAGAFISSLLLTVMPQTLKSLFSSSFTIQFIIMIAASVFMSTCSTSNAFIGRSFNTNFTIVPILAFITLGPMLDIKNMIMMAGILKKSFIIKLYILIIAAGFFIFSMIDFLW